MQIPDVDASVDVPDVSGDVSVAAPDVSLPVVSGEASLPSVSGDVSVPQVGIVFSFCQEIFGVPAPDEQMAAPHGGAFLGIYAG